MLKFTLWYTQVYSLFTDEKGFNFTSNFLSKISWGLFIYVFVYLFIYFGRATWHAGSQSSARPTPQGVEAQS